MNYELKLIDGNYYIYTSDFNVRVISFSSGVTSKERKAVLDAMNGNERIKSLEFVLEQMLSGYSGDDVRLLAVGLGGVVSDKIHDRCDAMNAARNLARELLHSHE